MQVSMSGTSASSGAREGMEGAHEREQSAGAKGRKGEREKGRKGEREKGRKDERMKEQRGQHVPARPCGSSRPAS